MFCCNRMSLHNSCSVIDMFGLSKGSLGCCFALRAPGLARTLQFRVLSAHASTNVPHFPGFFGALTLTPSGFAVFLVHSPSRIPHSRVLLVHASTEIPCFPVSLVRSSKKTLVSVHSFARMPRCPVLSVHSSTKIPHVTVLWVHSSTKLPDFSVLSVHSSSDMLCFPVHVVHSSTRSPCFPVLVVHARAQEHAATYALVQNKIRKSTWIL